MVDVLGRFYSELKCSILMRDRVHCSAIEFQINFINIWMESLIRCRFIALLWLILISKHMNKSKIYKTTHCLHVLHIPWLPCLSFCGIIWNEICMKIRCFCLYLHSEAAFCCSLLTLFIMALRCDAWLCFRKLDKLADRRPICNCRFSCSNQSECLAHHSSL